MSLIYLPTPKYHEPRDLKKHPSAAAVAPTEVCYVHFLRSFIINK